MIEVVRVALSIRALRRRRGWTQHELGARVGCSRSAIARLERGEADRFTVAFISRVLGALDARLALRVLWHGEDLDRLLDADHAALVEAVTLELVAGGWTVFPEVTFQVYGERGSIDVLAIHGQRSVILVVEVKSVVPDVQAMLAGIDRKVRLAPAIARDRGFGRGQAFATVSRLLVLPADRTSRRRIDRHAATFARVLPTRTVDVRRWLRHGNHVDHVGAPLAGIMFLSGVTTTRARQRAHRRGSSAERGDTGRSSQMSPTDSV